MSESATSNVFRLALARIDWKRAGVGALAGMVMGVLLMTLGFDAITGWYSVQDLLPPPIVIGAVCGAFGLVSVPLAIDVLLLLTYLVIANTPLMGRVAASWVRMDPVPASADAIVILSASVNSDGYLTSHGVQRLLTGIELFQTGVAPRLFTTLVDRAHGQFVRPSTPDQERLLRMGGAAHAWTSLVGVTNTRDEALRTAAQLPPGARTVIVVTSPMHTRRACATFEAVGFTVICAPSREQDLSAWHPIHSEARIEAFRQYAYERLGMIKYRAKGWLPKER